MAKNRIKELRISKGLTLVSLAQKVNDRFKEEYEVRKELFKEVQKNPDYFETFTVTHPENFNPDNEKIIQVTDSQLSQYENWKRSPRYSEVWEKLSEVLEVDISYLMGISEVDIPISNYPELENKGMSEAWEDFSELKIKTDDKVWKESMKIYEKIQLFDLKRSEAVLSGLIGKEKLEEIKERYSEHEPKKNYNYNDYKSLLSALWFFQSSSSGLTADYQMLSTFAQLTKKNQAKALEQVKNLLIVQKATEKHDKD